jgi:HEAT repeat protein
VRRSAAHGLARVKQSWAADILVRMLREDPEWLVQSAANAALQAHTAEDKDTTTVAPPPDITQLAWLKAWAAKHKWSVKTEEEALKILARAAEDDAPTTRMMVAYTLAYIGRWDHMPVLNELLTDVEPAVRHAAAQALRRVEDRYELGRRER